jgi:hypothetical protein
MSTSAAARAGKISTILHVPGRGHLRSFLNDSESLTVVSVTPKPGFRDPDKMSINAFKTGAQCTTAQEFRFAHLFFSNR